MSRTAMLLAAALVVLAGLFTYAWAQSTPQPVAVATVPPPPEDTPSPTPQPWTAVPVPAARPVQVITPAPQRLPDPAPVRLALPPVVQVPVVVPTPLPARTVAPVATPKPAPVPPHPQAGPVTTIDPGTWGVGDGIEAGTYRTTGSDSSDVPYCYWERLRNTSGELDAIIANDVVQGPAIVTIAPTDVAFKTWGCATWQKVS